MSIFIDSTSLELFLCVAANNVPVLREKVSDHLHLPDIRSLLKEV